MAGLLGTLGHRLPEPGLDIPAFLLREVVVPLGHVLLAVTGQPGDVEIQAGLLGQGDQSAQPIQVGLVRLLRAGHELGELEVNP